MASVIEIKNAISLANRTRGESKLILSKPIGIKIIIPDSRLRNRSKIVWIANLHPAFKRASLGDKKMTCKKLESEVVVFGLFMILVLLSKKMSNEFFYFTRYSLGKLDYFKR